MLDATVAGEIVSGFLQVAPEVHIAVVTDDFILLGSRLGDDLTGRRDDARTTDHPMAVFATRFRRSNHPRRILVGAGLHGQMIVEHLQMHGFVVGGVTPGGVVTEEHHLHALQAHDPVSLRPAAVVAYAHAHDTSKYAPHGKPEVADVEVPFFQVLVLVVRFVIRMSRQMHLSIFADDVAVGADNDRGVVVTGLAVFLREFGVAEIKSDTEPSGFLEQRPGRGVGHLLFEPAVDFIGIVDEIAWKKRGQRELWKHHQLSAIRVRLFQQFNHARDGALTAFGFLNGTELGGGDFEMAGHGRLRDGLSLIFSLTISDSGGNQFAHIASPYSSAPKFRFGSISGERAPRGSAAAGISHGRNAPLPLAALSSPCSTTMRPRRITVCGQPLRVLPS